jgi:pantoate--beta-alanine ligase
VRDLVAAEPLAALDYVSVAHPETLTELDEIAGTTEFVDLERKGQGAALVSLAARFGRARLLDNVTLGA